MSTFLLAFALLLTVVTGMSLGVLLRGVSLKGSCGGLNAVPGAERCGLCGSDLAGDGKPKTCRRKQRQASARQASAGARR